MVPPMAESFTGDLQCNKTILVYDGTDYLMPVCLYIFRHTSRQNFIYFWEWGVNTGAEWMVRVEMVSHPFSSFSQIYLSICLKKVLLKGHQHLHPFPPSCHPHNPNYSHHHHHHHHHHHINLLRQATAPFHQCAVFAATIWRDSALLRFVQNRLVYLPYVYYFWQTCIQAASVGEWHIHREGNVWLKDSSFTVQCVPETE